MTIGQYVTVDVPIGAKELRVRRRCKVVYINEEHRWFGVEVESTLGKWRTCYHMPPKRSPEPMRDAKLSKYI